MRNHPIPRFDVVDRDGNPLGYTASIRQAYHQGLWHRSVQVVVYTPAGEVLVQQRATGSVILPNYLDLSAGGGVDPGETPELAAARETAEELGIHSAGHKFEPLQMRRYNHRWPRLGVHSRALVYPFLLQVPNKDVPLRLQANEVAAAAFLPPAEVRRLVGLHRLKWGKLVPRYGFYHYLLTEVERRLV